jgi:hypothetical protein
VRTYGILLGVLAAGNLPFLQQNQLFDLPYFIALAVRASGATLPQRRPACTTGRRGCCKAAQALPPPLLPPLPPLHLPSPPG